MRELLDNHRERHAVLQAERDHDRERVERARDRRPLLRHLDEHLAELAAIVVTEREVEALPADARLDHLRGALARHLLFVTAAEGIVIGRRVECAHERYEYLEERKHGAVVGDCILTPFADHFVYGVQDLSILSHLFSSSAQSCAILTTALYLSSSMLWILRADVP